MRGCCLFQHTEKAGSGCSAASAVADGGRRGRIRPRWRGATTGRCAGCSSVRVRQLARHLLRREDVDVAPRDGAPRPSGRLVAPRNAVEDRSNCGRDTVGHRGRAGSRPRSTRERRPPRDSRVPPGAKGDTDASRRGGQLLVVVALKDPVQLASARGAHAALREGPEARSSADGSSPATPYGWARSWCAWYAGCAYGGGGGQAWRTWPIRRPAHESSSTTACRSRPTAGDALPLRGGERGTALSGQFSRSTTSARRRRRSTGHGGG